MGLDGIVVVVLRGKSVVALAVVRHLERDVPLPAAAHVERLLLLLCGLALLASRAAAAATAVRRRSLDATRRDSAGGITTDTSGCTLVRRSRLLLRLLGRQQPAHQLGLRQLLQLSLPR